MPNTTLLIDHPADKDVYFRIFNTAGEVFDFSDDAFKPLASATTPYIAAAERPAMGGTGWSGYIAEIDLAKLHTGVAPAEFFAIAYESAAPADSDVAISQPVGLVVQLGEEGAEPVYVECEASVLSSEGDEVHVTLWLSCRGRKVPIEGATCSVTFSEIGGDVHQFTLTEADKAGATAIVDDRFELMKTEPNFADDRQYAIDASITLGGVTYRTESNRVVIG